MKSLTPQRLLRSSLSRRRFRTTALAVVVALVTGGVALLSFLLNGMKHSVTVGAERFGADLVVVPRGGRAAVEGALIVGQATQLTLPAKDLDQIRALKVVETASPQIYVKTLTNASCCPGEFFLIGYDPHTDFTLAPWLAETGERLGAHDAIVGDRITLKVGATVNFFGTPFNIQGRLGRTGVGIDDTVFIPLEGLRDMVAHSAERAEEPLEIQPDEISVVLVKAAPGVDAPAVAEAIDNALDGIEVVLAPQVIDAALKDLRGVVRLLAAAAALLWLALLPLLGVTFSMSASEQRRDIGLWRALGATAPFVFRLVVGQAVYITSVGGLFGVGLAGVLFLAFGPFVSQLASVPFYPPGLPFVLGVGLVLLAAAVLTGCVAAYLPARAAARLEPYECIRQAEV